MFKVLLVPVAFATMALASPTAVQAQPSVFTVTVTDCGTGPQLSHGSTAYSGAVVPGPDTKSCTINFDPNSPFTTVVSGFSGPAAPLCNVQISQGHTKYSVSANADGIRVAWDPNVFVAPPPVNLVAWQCYYPWTPN